MDEKIAGWICITVLYSIEVKGLKVNTVKKEIYDCIRSTG